jgi:ketosteroid isomerase-like protein
MNGSVVVLLLLCTSLLAQSNPTSKAAEAPGPALMTKILAAWNTGDPANAAPYYDKSPDNVYFDFAPMQYKGWNEYDAGVKQALASFQSLKFTMHDDAKVHHAGNSAWATTTWSAQGKLKNGNGVGLEGRWTVIWEKRGNKWLIVHEHFSVPWVPDSESRHR